MPYPQGFPNTALVKNANIKLFVEEVNKEIQKANASNQNPAPDKMKVGWNRSEWYAVIPWKVKDDNMIDVFACYENDPEKYRFKVLFEQLGFATVVVVNDIFYYFGTIRKAETA